MKTFRDFMESSLYSPDNGFYNTRTPTKDFYTAPELHPAFAGILADETAGRLDLLKAQGVPGPYFIVEMGSGTGALGRALLRRLSQRHPGWAHQIRYVLVERCENLLLDSVVSFGDQRQGHILGYARLEEVLPCSGVFLSNELVDAFPFHLLEKRNGKMHEVYVNGDHERLGDFSSPELKPYADRIAPHMTDGGRHAVNLEAERWIRQVAKVMEAGFLITIDYGRRLGDEHANIPRAFYKHTLEENLTARSGRQDLTLSVDFEALIQDGARCGLSQVSYSTLSRFLLDRGILDWMPSTNPSAPRSYEERNKIKALFHPDAMGEKFKVLIQEKKLLA